MTTLVAGLTTNALVLATAIVVVEKKNGKTVPAPTSAGFATPFLDFALTKPKAS